MRDRTADIWEADRIAAQLHEIEALGTWVVISGGLAWHYMSPHHIEYRRFHDHKDVDLFVYPDLSGLVFTQLQARGFERQWTKYDRADSGFYRHTKYLGEGKGKVMLDLFIGSPPAREVRDRLVVEPSHLVTLYETSHSSKHCVAVQAAIRLLAQGIDPVGRRELIGE